MTDDVKDLLNQMLKNMLHGGDAVLQKMVLVDYIMSHFNSNQYDGKLNGVNPYIPTTEVEYILMGDKSGARNVFKTELSIYGIRLLMNTVSILSFKQEVLNTTSTEIAALTGGVSYPVIYGLVLAGWSGLESYGDLNTMTTQGTVKFFKMKGDIRLDLNLDKIINIDETIKALSNKTEKKQKTSPFDMAYKDYLFFLLLAQNEDVQLYRIMDVLMMRGIFEKYDFASKQTAIKLNVIVNVNTWFTDLFNNKDGFDYSLNYTRGY